MIKKTKIIYVLSHPYSGSTLLGLFLGNIPEITNLGEVVYLSSDYSDKKKCSCGSQLMNCCFWGEFKKHTEITNTHLSNKVFKSQKRDKIDQRGGFYKLFLRLGFPLRLFFNKNERHAYIQTNEMFFNEIDNFDAESDFFVDLSKSNERLELLKSSDKLDVYLIHLKRDLRSVFGSLLKRPKKTRAKYPFKPLRELLWLLINERKNRKLFLNHDPNKSYALSWNEFVKSPSFEIQKVFNHFRFENLNINKENRKITISDQHLYVGNLWLTRGKVKSVLISERDKADKLTKFQEWIFNTLNSILRFEK
jgi:hypothetical protein